LSAAERGERLFFDARLAHDHWLSCHSCHPNGHTIDLTADTLGDGDYGAPKRIPSLLGIADTAPFAWNGSVPDLEAQVQLSVTSTMHGRKLSPEQIADLVSFLRSLSPPLPPNVPLTTTLRRGRAVFRTTRVDLPSASRVHVERNRRRRPQG
jgi:cytochrome c peroxidase